MVRFIISQIMLVACTLLAEWGVEVIQINPILGAAILAVAVVGGVLSLFLAWKSQAPNIALEQIAVITKLFSEEKALANTKADKRLILNVYVKVKELLDDALLGKYLNAECFKQYKIECIDYATQTGVLAIIDLVAHTLSNIEKASQSKEPIVKQLFLTFAQVSINNLKDALNDE